MEYRVNLDKTKSIGKVVYIVEGQRKELTLLSHIFEKVLNYSVVVTPRDQDSYVKYENPFNPNSQVFLISAKNSNISYISNIEGKEYLDSVFKNLFETFSLDLTNAAVYYIFDRDGQSNSSQKYEKLIYLLKNARDNGIESNGLLLISYPSIEAYQKSCIDDTVKENINRAKSLKTIVGNAKYQNDKITSAALIKACINMLGSISELCNRDFEESDLDDFSFLSKEIIDSEDELYLKKKVYRILSLLSISFLDLGILNYEKESL